MELERQNLTKAIKLFWLKYETKIIPVIGLILVAGISFEAGALKSQSWQEKPIIIEKPAEAQACSETTKQSASKTPNSSSEAKVNPNVTKVQPKDCAFVGSKNSDKYHIPSCTFAKRIKPENIICFASAEDANARGYQPDKTCVK